jgi:hypothetical protein
MAGLDRRVVAWLKSHHATVASATLVDNDVSLDQRKRLVGAGTLSRVVDGAYVFNGVAIDELGRCAALCTSRLQLIIAGPTAGRLWAIRRSPRDGLIHVLAPPQSHPCREPWVKVYRTALIFDDDVVERSDGIRLTSPSRTCVDLSRYIAAPALASAIEYVLSAELCTLDTLYDTATRLATPGRPWARRFLGVLARRSPGAPAESEPELRVTDALIGQGVADLRRQFRVVVPGYGLARFDGAIPELLWAVEVDVHPEHATGEGTAKDKVRDRKARAIGWEIERVSEMDLTFRFNETINDLVSSIGRRREQVALLRSAGHWPPR